MHRTTGLTEPLFKIVLVNQDGSVKNTLQPFTLIQAKIELRKLGEPFGAKIELVEDE